jgi:hypothetical protein
MGLANTTCPDQIGYLTDIGFDEHAADTLYNNDNLSVHISEIYDGPGGTVDWAKTSQSR